LLLKEDMITHRMGNTDTTTINVRKIYPKHRYR